MISEKIKVIKIRLPQDGDSWGNLKALVDIELIDKGLKLHGFRVVQQDGQKAWVGSPTTTYLTKNGERVYLPLVRFLNEQEFYELQKQILSAYERIKGGNMLNE